MPGIQQPMNQIRLTNISLVRLKKNGIRFEIPCYKNKVLDYRSGADTDLDNILQIPQVFLNVGKGQVAPKDQLNKAFQYLNEEKKKSGKGGKAGNSKKAHKGGGKKHKHGKHARGDDGDEEEDEELEDVEVEDVIREMLDKGEMQVGEKERRSELERTEREVIDMVAGMCVDTRSGRVYSTGMIEKALAELTKEGGRGRPGEPHHGVKKAGGSASGSTNVTEGMRKMDVSGSTDPAKAAEADSGREKIPIWTGVVTTKSAKSQALEAIKALIYHQPMPIARARMRLRVEVPASMLMNPIKPKADAEDADTGTEALKESVSTLKEAVLARIEQVESQSMSEGGDGEWSIVCSTEPGALRILMELMKETKGRGRVEVLDMAVIREGAR